MPGLGRAVVRLAGVAEDARRRRRVHDRRPAPPRRPSTARASARPPPGSPGSGPRRWTLMTASHSSTDMLNTIRSRRIPALFTTTSSRPQVSSAGAMSDCGALRLGDVLEVRRPPRRRRAVISSTTCDAGAVVRPGPVPLAAEVVDHDPGALLGEQQRLAAADPRPAPVMTATLPSSMPMCWSTSWPGCRRLRPNPTARPWRAAPHFSTTENDRNRPVARIPSSRRGGR